MARPPAQHDAYQLRYISLLLRSNKEVTPNPKDFVLASRGVKITAEHVN